MQFQQELWMNDQLKMLFQMNYENTSNAIFSQGLESGVTSSIKLDGPMTNQSGQEAALASLSARQAKEKGLLMSGTFGPHFSISSASASLTQFLASRLRVRTDLLGSTLFRLTWKERATPLGRSIPALRASVHRIFGKDYGSALPTPTVRDYRHGMSEENLKRRKLHSRGVNLNEFMQRELGVSGKLNPLFVCLLMGLPTVWDDCAAMVTPLSRRKRKVL
jgi:hypothetical protein